MGGYFAEKSTPRVGIKSDYVKLAEAFESAAWGANVVVNECTMQA